MEFVGLATATSFYKLSQVLAAVLLARTLGPAGYGVYASIFVLLTYANYSHFGIQNAFNLRLPMLLAAGRAQDALELRRVTWAGMFVSGSAGAVAASIGAALIFGKPSVWLSAAAFVAFLGVHAIGYAQTELKASKAFRALSLNYAFGGAVIPAGLVLGAFFGGVNGALVGLGAGSMLNVGVNWRRLGLRYGPAFDLARMGELVRFGLPILFSGAAFFLLTSVDRWIVIGTIGAQSFGKYALMATLCSLPFNAASVIADQFYPRAAAAFARNPSTRAIRPFMVRQFFLTLATVGSGALFLAIALPLAINNFLPAFSEALVMTGPLLVGVLFLALGYSLGGFFVVCGQTRPYLISLCLSASLAAVAFVVTSEVQPTLFAFSVASTASFFIFFGIQAVLALRSFYGKGREQRDERVA